MNATTLKIVEVIETNLITMSLIAIELYCGYTQTEIITALRELHQHGYLEPIGNYVYIKTAKWDTL